MFFYLFEKPGEGDYCFRS